MLKLQTKYCYFDEVVYGTYNFLQENQASIGLMVKPKCILSSHDPYYIHRLKYPS